MQPAIIFDGVFKKFRRGERHDSLRDLIPAATRRLLGRRPVASTLDQQEFWAVHNVSFQVRPGEALGIIGPNGAGKSTILKLLSRILRPTQGRCEIRGRVGALIEVAAGFHPDLTGRENVYLQGAVMGMKRAEITRNFNEIVEFAGIGKFIDTPVKRYSSGMNARLGFAIAAHLNPDVLLIDEVLSVGDTAFQEKCLVRMRELIRRGVPLVFISHNLPAILDLCTRAIVVDNGTVRLDSTPAAAIQEYRLATSRSNVSPAAGPARIAQVELLNERGEPSAVFHTGGSMRVKIRYETSGPVADAAFEVDFHRADGAHCAGINTLMDRRAMPVLEGEGAIDLVLPRLNLLRGCYHISVGILNEVGETHDLRKDAYPFTVMSDSRDAGIVYLDHEWVNQATASELAHTAMSPVSITDRLRT